jgi:hypothetical protein
MTIGMAIQRQVSSLMTGIMIYLLGAPICWRSKGHKGVTPPRSKIENVARLEAVKEICFTYFLLKEIED